MSRAWRYPSGACACCMVVGTCEVTGGIKVKGGMDRIYKLAPFVVLLLALS